MLKIRFQFGYFSGKKAYCMSKSDDSIDLVEIDGNAYDHTHGYVRIRRVAGISTIVGKEGTWVEYNGIRYETREEYQMLRAVVEREKLDRALEAL